MVEIGIYQIQKEILKLNNNLSLWLAESTEGFPVEILTIKKNKEYQTLLDRIIKNEIQPLVNANFEGFQKILQVDYDSKNETYFIVYELLGHEYNPLSSSTLNALKSIISGLAELKKQNRFCHIIAPSVIMTDNERCKLRFLGLF